MTYTVYKGTPSILSSIGEAMSYYTHKDTNKSYAVLQECKMKIGDRWVDGVVYLKDGKMFCRTRMDFFENFEKKKK